ncbi:pentapeptide repeat-containing protein [Pseudomonadota bacterium]
MNEDPNKGKQKLWYVKHKSEVLGPFPSGAVRRSLLLGRVLITDEVTFDGKIWQPASRVPEVVPPELRKALEEGDESALLVGRMREDMRTGRERRTAESDKIHHQRRKGERRAEEAGVVNKRRAARSALLKQKKERLPLRSALISTLLVAGIIGYGLYYAAPTITPEPECERTPAPGINWQNCRLDGVQFMNADLTQADIRSALLRGANLSGALFVEANLEYVDFSGADLSYAQLERAQMKGANLQNTDLTHAVLTGADLSFAILRGATPGGVILENAKLDDAIWFDGGTCLAGSIGVCNRKIKQ